MILISKATHAPPSTATLKERHVQQHPGHQPQQLRLLWHVLHLGAEHRGGGAAEERALSLPGSGPLERHGLHLCGSNPIVPWDILMDGRWLVVDGYPLVN